MLTFAPIVFAVEQQYCIKTKLSQSALVWIRIEGRDFFDDCNGVLRSTDAIHDVYVPMAILDQAKQYTVCVRPIIDRKPYFPQTGEVKEYTFPFHPLPKTDIKLYHISDAHHRLETPIAAAHTFGAIDGLILNGDLFYHADDPAVFDHIFAICDALTGGSVPVIAARGNHDMRGAFAEQLARFMPLSNGRSYYTFRLGSLWGVILDCAEDKPDDHEEYGHTVACHAFRQAQTAFLESVIRNADREYLAEGITTRLVICHNPFVKVLEPPFNIEEDTYLQWSALLNDHIHPHAMICGHLHSCFVQPDAIDGDLPFPCPLIVGSNPSEEHFTGCGIRITENSIYVSFTDNNGQISEPITIPK